MAAAAQELAAQGVLHRPTVLPFVVSERRLVIQMQMAIGEEPLGAAPAVGRDGTAWEGSAADRRDADSEQPL